ncbi:MAG: rubrerythrin family protein [Mariprofundus sp.]|nr:rubrerythrin family protein [Mariprofundus sp.]
MRNAAKYSISQTSNVVATSRRRFLVWIGAGLAALAIPRPLWSVEDPKTAYRETIAVLTMLYHGEVESHRRYDAYKKQALKDGHVNIAHLFAAMADSESVHEKRFSEILAKLGVQVESTNQSIQVGSTKENLKYATDVELSEIDVNYPKYLARIWDEKHSKALKYIDFSWKSEKQHRELIKDIQSGTGVFFGILVERFRSTTVRYFVCQNCGSTLTAKPNERCPICTLPVSWYKEIKLPTL